MPAPALIAAVIFTYWVEPCQPRPDSNCIKEDPQLAVWALEAWQRESHGHLIVKSAATEQEAQIRIRWVRGDAGLYGEATIIEVNGKRGAVIEVLPGTSHLSPAIHQEATKDSVLRNAILYVTCLHETGHALGLAHTRNFDDIMYSFGYGGDIAEYFQSYRRRLQSTQDIAATSGLSERDQERMIQALDRMSAVKSGVKE